MKTLLWATVPMLLLAIARANPVPTTQAEILVTEINKTADEAKVPDASVKPDVDGREGPSTAASSEEGGSGETLKDEPKEKPEEGDKLPVKPDVIETTEIPRGERQAEPTESSDEQVSSRNDVILEPTKPPQDEKSEEVDPTVAPAADEPAATSQKPKEQRKDEPESPLPTTEEPEKEIEGRHHVPGHTQAPESTEEPESRKIDEEATTLLISADDGVTEQSRRRRQAEPDEELSETEKPVGPEDDAPVLNDVELTPKSVVESNATEDEKPEKESTTPQS